MADIFTSLLNDFIGLAESLESVLALYGLYCVWKYFGKKTSK